MNNYKKTILIDLDGVLNQYEGNFDENRIPPIKKGAVDFLKKAANDYELKLFTTRNRLLASKWLIENNLDEYFSDITNVKIPVWLIVDDRCVKFQGDYDNLYNEIKDFKVWYK